MKLAYHKLMFRVNAFLFGSESVKAHKHLGYILTKGFRIK